MTSFSPKPEDTEMPSTVVLPTAVNIDKYGTLIKERFGKGKLFAICEVDKVTGSGGKKTYKRLLCVSKSFLFVARIDGSLSRVIRHWTIEKVHYRPLQVGVEFILQINEESTLVFRDESQEPWKLLEVLNSCRFYLMNSPAPLPIQLLHNHEAAKQLYDFKKRKHQNPRERLRQMNEGPGLAEYEARTTAQRVGFMDTISDSESCKKVPLNEKVNPEVNPEVNPDIIINLSDIKQSIGLVMSSDLTILHIGSDSPAEVAGARRFIGGKVISVNGVNVSDFATCAQQSKGLLAIPLVIEMPPLEPHTETPGEEEVVFTKQRDDDIGIEIREDMNLVQVVPGKPADCCGIGSYLQRKLLAVNGLNLKRKHDLERFKDETSLVLTFAPVVKSRKKEKKNKYKNDNFSGRTAFVEHQSNQPCCSHVVRNSELPFVQHRSSSYVNIAQDTPPGQLLSSGGLDKVYCNKSKESLTTSNKVIDSLFRIQEGTEKQLFQVVQSIRSTEFDEQQLQSQIPLVRLRPRRQIDNFASFETHRPMTRQERSAVRIAV